MNLAKSSIKLFAANIAGAGFQFLGITFFARELGASQMGIFFLFQALLGILAIPADFGLRGAVEKRISEGDSPGVFLSSAIALKTIPITVIILGILMLRPWINGYIGAEVAVLLALAILLQEMAKLAVGALNGELRVGETAVLKVARQVTWVGGGFLLVGYGLKAEAMIYSLLTGMGVMLVWGWYKSSIPLQRPTITHARSLFDYSRYNVVSSIGGYFYSWMDVAIIGLFLTQAHVGTYEIAWRVTALSILFSQAIAMTIFPQVSEWSAEGAKERIESLVAVSMTPSVFFVIPAFFGTVILSQEILTILFGQEYSTAAVVLIVLMGDKVFQAIQLVVGKSLQAINKPNLAARATVVSVVSNAVLNAIFILEFGILGAAVATVASSLLNDLLHLLYLRRYIHVQFPHREIIECIFASLVMAGVLLLLEGIYEVRNLVDLTGVILVGIIIYMVSAILLPNLRSRILIVTNRMNGGKM